ncbi:hypothetical protein Tco_1428184 [Tanacetum coccineum]
MTNVVPTPPTDPPNTLDASRISFKKLLIVWILLIMVVLNPVDALVVDAGGDLPGGFPADAPVVDAGGDFCLVCFFRRTPPVV